MAIDFKKINKDKNLFMVNGLPLITVYDDNLFVRNDYDVLSVGQRNYLIKVLEKHGLVQVTGQVMESNDVKVEIPKPNSNLAVSSFDEKFLVNAGHIFYCVTPTMFAETLFYKHKDDNYYTVLKALRRLIKKCPYNIEWLRDVSYRSPIEKITQATYKDLLEYQKFIVRRRFKSKKAL